MAKKHVQIPQLYFADQVGIGIELNDGTFKIENVLSGTEIKFRYSMAVSAEEAANNIKYKTATKKAGADWKNYIGFLKVHFAPYPGTTVFPKDAEEYNKKQEEKNMNKNGVGNENANAIENANVQKEEEKSMNKIIDNTVNNYMEEAKAAAINPVPNFMDAVNNLNEEEAETMNTEERALLEEQAFQGEVEAINENDKELAKIEKIIIAAGGAFAHLKGKVFVMSDNGGIKCDGDIAIEVARKVWVEAGKIFDQATTTAIRTGLKELFYSNKAKQETTAQSKTDTVEKKAPESAVENKKEETTMTNNPYDAVAAMQPTFNPYITVRFNVIKGGEKVPQERSITCLSMKDRMKLAAEGKVKPMKLESPTYYTGSLFNGNKKVGTWAWNTVRWAYPTLTLDTADGKKKTYSFNGTDHDKPLDNVSILLMAMVQVIGTVRGVKSTVKYYPKKSGNTAPRTVAGTAKPSAPAATVATAPAVVETTPSIEEDVAFFMN